MSKYMPDYAHQKERQREIMRTARQRVKLKQQEMGKRIGYTQSNYSKMERGIVPMNAFSWLLFCKITKTNVHALMEGYEYE